MSDDRIYTQADLEAAVSVVRAEVERVESERSTALTNTARDLNRALDRAESAEADLRALREGLEALADEYAANGAAREAAGKPAWPNNVARDIRALLAPSPAEGTGEAACPGCGSTACKWKRLECEREVTR